MLKLKNHKYEGKNIEETLNNNININTLEEKSNDRRKKDTRKNSNK